MSGRTERAHSAPPTILPLFRLFPALASIPRASLGTFPTPVERLELPGLRGDLWIKRDDLNAPSHGGNKVRSLEFLLGAVRAGDTVLTVGGHGSTHVMSTAAHARRLGARVKAVRFPHDMNPVAAEVGDESIELGTQVIHSSSVVTGLVRAQLSRIMGRAHWIPLGGTSPVGVLGHVNAALELDAQLRAGDMPLPDRITLPLGTAGTAGGLALGLALVRRDAQIVAARVAPRVATHRLRAMHVARATARFIERVTGEPLPRPDRTRISVWHHAYAGAYGRPHPAASAAARLLHEHTGLVLDDTYSAKAFAAALELARRERGVTLFWLTFDARWMHRPARTT